MAQFSIWLAAGLTLALYSFLWRDNPLYRAAEYLYVGVGAGYGIVLYYDTYIKPNIVTNIGQQHQYILLVPIAIGLLMYARYFKSIAFLSRWAMAFFMGIGSGYVLTTEIQTRFVAQIAATIKPFWTAKNTVGVNINNTLLALGVICTLIYFFFTTKKVAVLDAPARFGRIVMMVAFGSAFANTVMGRVTLFLGRINFLLGTWLHILK